MLPLVSRSATQSSTGLFARAAKDERGAVGMIFALTLTGVIMFLACAIDIGRASLARVKVASAVDAASIFAAKALKDSSIAPGDLEALARKFFDENMKTGTKLSIVTDFKLTMTPDGKGVTINVKSDMPTTFARIAGIKTIAVPGNATAIFNSQDIEVGVQLDVTGSMSETINGTKKIDSLKAATKNLVDILLPASGTGTTKVRVGIAPFAAGVNAGTYASSVAGKSASGGCLYERKTSFSDASDASPAGADVLKTLADLPGGAQACPSNAKVAALSADKNTLLPTINALSPNGSTAGHLGTSWAWYLLSPNWSSVWPSASKPADYNDGKTLKFAILMTDGIYNTVGGFSGNDANAQSRAKALCDGMKNKGIVVYSVGFIKPGDPAAAADTLKYCASGTNHFFKAEDGAQLDSAFQSIAKDISRLRLSK